MGVLPLVPVVLLGIVLAWLFWPVVIDLKLRLARPRKPAKEDADSVAEALFDVWSEHGEKPGLIHRRRAT